MTTAEGNATRRPIAFAVSLGLLGGAALIATEWLTTKGPLIFIPYGALVVVTLMYLRAEKVRPFGRRFAMALGAFMVATIVLMAWIVTIANPAALTTPLWSKVWPLLVMLGIGAVLSAAVAQLSSTDSHRNEGSA